MKILKNSLDNFRETIQQFDGREFFGYTEKDVEIDGALDIMVRERNSRLMQEFISQNRKRWI